MQLGEKDHPKTREEAGATSKPEPYIFGWPSKLAFLPDGSFLLADGYWNSRIVKYTADGKPVSEFGALGDGPGESAIGRTAASRTSITLGSSSRSGRTSSIPSRSGSTSATRCGYWTRA
ncbi:MAG: hypothetical protein ACRD21_11420 [Vicinamibacteria bacterium]